jgi:hypothetical protein
MADGDIVFERAALLCYRLYDIADEIDLEAARRLLTEELRPLRLTREGAQYLELPRPPLGFTVGGRPLPLRDSTQLVDVTVRLFDHGAASVQVRVPITPGTRVSGLTPLADELYDSDAVDALCREVLEGVRHQLAPAMEGAHRWGQHESYTIIFAEELGGVSDAQGLLKHVDLARLLLGETGDVPLSRDEREEVTHARFSYTDRDLVVVDWNAAFVWEPSGSSDIPLLLELANAQLLELRYYDELLDVRLAATYDQIGKKRQDPFRLIRSPYHRLARRTLGTLMELQEFVERADNSLKVIGDVYLAKVYEAAVQQLRIPPWQASVTRKQDLLARTYGLLKGEIDTDRALTLEAAIVLLIVLEIVLAMFKVLT